MKALITGASSGIGWDMAHILSEMGYEIIAVARRRDKLLKLKEELGTDVEIIVCDISKEEECLALSKKIDDVDIFINNAGFGVFGDFSETSLDDELKMIDTNLKAVHILTKLAVKKFKERDNGYILNVASLAAFFPGPLFGAYYASKAYVLRLSQAVSEELRRTGSNVKISVLCPGPVHTEFGKVAKVKFGTGNEFASRLISPPSRYVAEYAIKKMFSGKPVIIPCLLLRTVVMLRHFVSDKFLSKLVYLIQNKKVLR